MMEQRSLAFIAVALGTRGDCSPVACLAKHVLQLEGTHSAHLITHSAHAPWLAPPSPFDGLALHYVPFMPSSHWSDHQRGGEGPQAEEEEFRQHMATYHAVRSITRQLIEDGTSCGQQPQIMLCFNLFSLEVWSIAEALGVPCIAAAPVQIPYRCPSGFVSGLARQSPQLHASLERARSSGGALVSMAEVTHWMWPLFSSTRWRDLRQYLGLAPRILHDRHTHRPVTTLPPPTPLLYGFSEAYTPRPGCWPSSVHVCGFWMPKREWLPPSLPQHAISALQEASQRHQRSLQTQPPSSPPPTPPAALPQSPLSLSSSAAATAATAAATKDGAEGAASCVSLGPLSVSPPPPPAAVLADFSSMGHIGLIPDPFFSCEVLARALVQAQRFGLLLTSWPPLQRAHSALPPHLQHHLLLLEGPIPHALLLPRCALLLHCGGAGTTAAGLSTGTPQLLCPLHFDQFYHAERMGPEGLGLAPYPLAKPDLFSHNSQAVNKEVCVSRVARALVDALRPHRAQACHRFAEELRGEDGLAAAGALIQQEAHKWQ